MRFASFSDMLEHYARKTPDAPAFRSVSDEGNGSTDLNYGDLLRKVQKRAAVLEADNGSCLAVLAECSQDCIIEIFAANAAGLRVVMLDPGLPDELLMQLVMYAHADRVWSSDTGLLDQLAGALPSVVSGDLNPEKYTDQILFFTSGTTSRSKAVVLTGRSLCSSAWNGSQKLPLSGADTLLCLLPLAHVFGFICGLLWGLSCGACVALGNGPRGIFTDFSLFRPTAVSLVPAQLVYFLKAGVQNPELKNVLIGAGDCDSALIENAKALGLHLSFGYGLTETSSGVAISTGGDPFAMEICPDDRIFIAEDGEVLIYAPTCIMQGYFQDPESTRQALTEFCPAGESDKFVCLKSGDLGYLDDEGRLHITGRKKDMLVLPDGTKIFLPEYEEDIIAALMRGMKAADPANSPEFEIAVDLMAGRPVLICSGSLSRSAVLEMIRPVMAGLPRGQQISDIIMVSGPLPRTATGKLKRWETRQRAGLQ